MTDDDTIRADMTRSRVYEDLKGCNVNGGDTTAGDMTGGDTFEG